VATPAPAAVRGLPRFVSVGKGFRLTETRLRQSCVTAPVARDSFRRGGTRRYAKSRFGREVEQAEDAWLEGIRRGDAALYASVNDEGARSCPLGWPMAEGLEAIRASWQREIDRGLRDGAYTTLLAEEEGGLGFEIGTYVFRVSSPGSGEQQEEHGKYIGVFRVRPDGSVRLVADCWNDDGPA